MLVLFLLVLFLININYLAIKRRNEFHFKMTDYKISKFKEKIPDSNEQFENRIIQNSNNEENKQNLKNIMKKKKLNPWFFLPIGIIILVLVIFLSIKFGVKNNKINHDIDDDNDNDNDNDNKTNYIELETDKNEIKTIKSLESLFTINTNVGELKRIFVHQNYYIDKTTDGILTRILVDRKTYYDIYIISEKEADEQTKNFYKKIYTASIAISSQCISINDKECNPKKLIDLAEVNNIDNIDADQLGDLKDLPLPICLFNLTDNNVITSITCPETFDKSSQDEMILDLYFFRPPAIKRIDKNSELKIIEDKENKRKYIREKNKGICDVYNSINSYCTTDMNTTTDSDNNILSYDENAFTRIVSGSNDSFIKNKTTHLIDVSENYLFLNPENYLKILNIFLSKLSPYMKYIEHFSLKDFEQFLLDTNDFFNKKPKRRNLETKESTIINEQEIFKYNYDAVEIGIGLKNNLGYNSDAMEASLNGRIDDYTEVKSNSKVYSNITNIINKLITLSNAGNNLAEMLRKYVETNFFDIIQAMNIYSIKNLITYKNISELFDPRFYLKYTSMLPLQIVYDSNDLVVNLEKILNGIKNGNLKKNLNVLKQNIDNYIRQSHIFINNIFNNIKDLGDSLDSKKNKLTEISTYYSEQSNTSYANIIKTAQNILMNYYKLENETINVKIGSLLKDLENQINHSVIKEINSVNEIYSSLVNKSMSIESIEEGDDEGYETLKNNLNEINNYIPKIINEIKNKIENEIDIKDSNYTISLYDIESNNKTYSQVLEKAKSIAIKLDNDEFIDKNYDKIMISFRENYIEIQKYMNNKNQEIFPLIVQENIFNKSQKESIKDELILLRAGIVDFVKKENEEYINNINDKVNKFLSENKEYLNQLIYNITILLSDKSFEKLNELFEIGFNNCLSRLEEELNQNKNLTINYFSNLTSIFENNEKIFDLIETLNPIDRSSIGVPLEYHACWNYGTCYSYISDISDIISSVNNTLGYLRKYSIFKNKFQISKEYYEYSQFFRDLSDKYKNIIIETKKVLQSIKNNKITEEYDGYEQLLFINDNIKDIDELYTKINDYLSEDIFNEKYSEIIDNFKTAQISEINGIDEYIDSQHKIIKNKNTNNDNNNDFCFGYFRKKTITCTNGCISKYEEFSPNCLLLGEESNNFNKIVIPSIDNDHKLNDFINIFNELHSQLTKFANNYNNKINELKNIISSTEQEIIEKQKDSNYLSSIDNSINNILKSNYEDKLIRIIYEYYKNITEENFDILFDNISILWNNAFDNLQTDVEKNFNNLTHTSYGLGLMALIYENIITKNITNKYFDSIVNHQKSEFNYSIAYSYNFLYKQMNSTYHYIINQIPSNEKGFNNIINLRKNEINNHFNNLIERILESKRKALIQNNQNDILQVSSSNFFKLNNKLANYIRETSDSLKNKALSIFGFDNGIEFDVYTLTCEFYSENIQSGKQIDKIYESIDHNFVELFGNDFKKLLEENIEFEKNKFVKDINTEIINSNNRILDLYSEQKKSYEILLENEIKRLFTKESLYEYIDHIYEKNNKNLDDVKKQQIYLHIKEIINLIKSHISKEAQTLNKKLKIYNYNFSKINETIKNFEQEIIEKIEKAIVRDIEELNNNIIENIYNKKIIPKLEDYLNKVKEYKSVENKEYNLINYSFKIGDIIYEIVLNLVEKYKIISKNMFDFLKDEYIIKRRINIDLDFIKNLVINEIENEFNSNLLIELNKTANYEVQEIYDLDNEIKNNISLTIDSNIKIIIMITSNLNYSIENLVSLNEDFDNTPTIFIDIADNFGYFIKPQITKQKTEFDDFIINLLESTFNNIIGNIIFSFGNDFFERILEYNENYKITTLYTNLRHSLVITLQYYISLYSLDEVSFLTKDLKLKLFNLNNLDIRAKAENNKILELLNKKIEIFIEDSKEDIIKTYINYLKENNYFLDSSFNDYVKERITMSIEISRANINNNYVSLLRKIFKENFVYSYTKIINKETKEMIDFVKGEKEYIRSILEEYMSLDEDNILNSINTKINQTSKSFEDFNNYIDQFKISDDLVDFLINYGTNNIHPLYEQFTNSISLATKDKIITYLNKNCEDFEKSYNNINDITDIINNLYLRIKNNFTNINNSINNYHGIEEYPEYLEMEINRINDRRMRRLNDKQTEEGILEEFKERFPDSSLDENFQKILNSSKNAKNFVNTFEKFEELKKMISSYIIKLNTSYDNSRQSIKDNFEIDSQILYDKLDNLRNICLYYYDNISERIVELNNYINKSIYEFNDLLNRCANITYQTFTYKYDEISNESKSIDEKSFKRIDETKMDSDSTSQNTKYLTNITFKNLVEEAEFVFELIFNEEDNIKKPKVIANIINRSRPKEVVIKINLIINSCEKIVHEIKINFNNINYTTNIEFNMNSTNIFSYITANFEPFTYYLKTYKISKYPEEICPSQLDHYGAPVCYPNPKCDHETIISNQIMKTQNRINFTKNNYI